MKTTKITFQLLRVTTHLKNSSLLMINNLSSSFYFLLFFSCLFFHSQNIDAQITFQKMWGGTGAVTEQEEGISVKQTSDGGYILCGFTQSFSIWRKDEMFLVKTDAYGDTLWAKAYGGNQAEVAKTVLQTTDGGYLLIGWTGSFHAAAPSWGSDCYLIKTNSTGDTLWTKTYGTTTSSYNGAYSGQQTADGGYVVVGSIGGGIGAGGYDVYLIKTNSTGDTLWTKTYGGTGGESGYKVEQTTDGGYIVSGTTTSYGAGGVDIYLIKTNPIGDTLWTKTYGGTGNDRPSTQREGPATSVRQTTDGGYVIIGTINDDMLLIKTNSTGDTLWTKTYGGVAEDAGFDVKQTTDGGYIMSGYTKSFGIGGTNLYLVKTNSTGDTLWTRAVGSGSYARGYSVEQTTDGGYVVAGYANGWGGAIWSDAYLLKTNAAGNIDGCEDTYSSTATIVGSPTITVGYGGTVSSGGVVSQTGTITTIVHPIDTALCVVLIPIANFEADDTTICVGDCINFTDLSIGAPTTWQWSFPGATIDTSTAQNPTNICYDTAGTYDVHLIATNANGSDTDTIVNYITVGSIMNATITSTSIGPFCPRDVEATLTAISGGGSWTGNGIIDSLSGIFNPDTAGTGTHTITYTLSGLCGDNDTVDLVVNPAANATITPPPNTFCLSDPIFTLQATNPGGIWFGNGIIDTVNGTFEPDSAGIGNHIITYTINGLCGDLDTEILTVTSDTVCVEIIVKEESDLVVYNVFSPNADGFNDVFTTTSKGITIFYGAIFNRWGMKLYEWENVDGYWDGTYNGKGVPDGTYYYVIAAEGIDNISYNKSGIVTLIR